MCGIVQLSVGNATTFVAQSVMCWRTRQYFSGQFCCGTVVQAAASGSRLATAVDWELSGAAKGGTPYRSVSAVKPRQEFLVST